MAEDESYEIMPYKEIVALKKEMEDLKKKTGDTSSKELINSMAKLTKGMDTMLQLFRTAAEEMKAEETTEDKFAANLEPLMDKLNQVIEQNKTIAEGMVAIADIVKGRAKQPPRPKLAEPRPFGPDLGLNPREPTGLSPLGPPPIAEPGIAPLGAPPIPPGAPPTPLELPPMPPTNLPPLGPPGAPPTQLEKPKKRGLFGFRKK